MLPKLVLAAAIILILTSILFLLPKHKNVVNDIKPVVFFGNSITAGEGAGLGEDFPSLIGERLNVEIVNAGVSGNTTQDALQRIDNDVLSKNPSIVVVELGGNDLLEGINVNVTARNLDTILSKIKAADAKIVILGIKFVLFGEKYEVDWASLAKKYDAVYVPDILEGVISDESLKSDDIHPNAKGHLKIADKLTPIIAPLATQKNKE